MADDVDADLKPGSPKSRGRKSKEVDPAATHLARSSSSDPWSSPVPTTAKPGSELGRDATPSDPKPQEAPLAAPEATAPKFDWFKKVGWYIGIIGLPIFSVVYGIKTLKAAQRGVRVNKGGAIAALVLGGGVILAATGGILAAVLEPGESRGIEELAVGDCFTDKGFAGDEVFSVRVIDCAEPHYGQIYYISSLPAGPYPGDSSIVSLIGDACYAESDRFILGAADPYGYTTFLYPTREAWNDDGDRSFRCLVVTDGEDRFIGSVLAP